MAPTERELRKAISLALSDEERERAAENLEQYLELERKIRINQDKKIRRSRKRKPKKKGRVDARSHKHAAIDASKGGSGIGGSLAPIIAAYTWLKEQGYVDEKAVLDRMVCMVPDHVWAIIALLGLGWWLIVYVAKLVEKYNKEF